MKKIYEKAAKAIEALQKARADDDEPQSPLGFKALHAIRQTQSQPHEKGE